MATSIGIGVSPVFQLKKAAFHNSLVDAWFMSGYSNSDKPKEIVGVRGNAIDLKNFLYAKNSGFGKYAEDFMSRFSQGETSLLTIKEKTTSSITISKLKKGRGIFEFNIDGQWGTYNFKGYSIKVEGYPPNLDQIEFYSLVSNGGESQSVNIKGDGIYTLDDHVYQQFNEEALFYHGLVFNTNADVDCNLTITQIPEGEGSLCFDGVDDFTGNIPLVNSEKGTIIIKYFVPIGDKGGMVLQMSEKIDDSYFRSCFVVFPDSVQLRDDSGNSVTAKKINTPKGEEYTVALTWDNNGMKATSYKLGEKTEISSISLNKVNAYNFGRDWNSFRFCDLRLYYVGSYSEPLSPQEIEVEKIKLEQKWKSKLK